MLLSDHKGSLLRRQPGAVVCCNCMPMQQRLVVVSDADSSGLNAGKGTQWYVMQVLLHESCDATHSCNSSSQCKWKML